MLHVKVSFCGCHFAAVLVRPTPPELSAAIHEVQAAGHSDGAIQAVTEALMQTVISISQW
jgi:hypothetical protein